jgi:hypothetical protein
MDAGAAGPDLDGDDGGHLAHPLSAVGRGAAVDLGLPRFEMARGDGFVVFVSDGGHRGRALPGIGAARWSETAGAVRGGKWEPGLGNGWSREELFRRRTRELIAELMSNACCQIR